jgi:hypothetical protein
VRVIRSSDENEMVACFLAGELASERFGPAVRQALRELGQEFALIKVPDLADEHANAARRAVLGATRGYGQDRELFGFFPRTVAWNWATLSPEELARVRYIEYSYWNAISGGSRLPADAANRIRAGETAFGVSNQRLLDAADAISRGARFPPLILAGVAQDDLVCLEGHLRLTGYALNGFPAELECLVAISPALARWAQ